MGIREIGAPNTPIRDKDGISENPHSPAAPGRDLTLRGPSSSNDPIRRLRNAARAESIRKYRTSSHYARNAHAGHAPTRKSPRVKTAPPPHTHTFKHAKITP